MNIVIITSIMLPMPPVKGGAVQNLIKLFLDDNEKKMKIQSMFLVFMIVKLKYKLLNIKLLHSIILKTQPFLKRFKN